MSAISANASSIARWASASRKPWTRIATLVPRSGRARSILRKDDVIRGQEALDAFGNVPARESGSRNILNVLFQDDRCAAAFADELRAPKWFANLAAIGFAIFENLDALDAAIGIKC